MADLIVILPILLFSVIIHEIAHGWVALKCGDPTARDAGRLTLNPIPHIDPFMTIILPLILIFQSLRGGSFFIFGGAKPVPINPSLLRGGEKDQVKVSFAGPASNILMALGGFVVSAIVILLFRNSRSAILVALVHFLKTFILINLVLANFNLLPIPPLDGSWILSYFLKGEAKRVYFRLQAAGFRVFIIFMVLAWLTGLFSFLFTPTTIVYELFRNWLWSLAT